MFNNLYKLYRNNNSLRTPLEDFNTECFAGILSHHPEILKKFLDFLKLPSEEYIVETQNYYPLSKYPNCFVDIVLISDSCVCFVEVKVNSAEGENQLYRYSEVLSSLNKKEKHLRYITKWSEPKINTYLNFSQHRWYELGYLLQENFITNTLVQDYLEFLKTHNMAQQKEITTETVIALKNFYQAYSTAKLHFSNGREVLRKAFPKCTTKDFKDHHRKSYKLIIEGNRIAYYIPSLFQTQKNYHSEILIALHIGEVRYQVQLRISANHLYKDIIKTQAKLMNGFDVVQEDSNGLMINCHKTLYQFIEVEDADLEIKKWFELSLEKIKKLITALPELDWDEKVLVI